jgi:pantetheine-phosphate adenylyltransferase
MSATGFYAGSFDPVTNGHLDVVRHAVRLFPRLVIAIGVHPGKKAHFDAEKRAAMLRRACEPIARHAGATLDVVSFDDLAIDAVRRHGASALIRGLRDGTDLDYEMQMAGMNETLAPDIQTVFLPASPMVRPITATLVRQIAAMGGDVRRFVPDFVADELHQSFSRKD